MAPGTLLAQRVGTCLKWACWLNRCFEQSLCRMMNNISTLVPKSSSTDRQTLLRSLQLPSSHDRPPALFLPATMPTVFGWSSQAAGNFLRFLKMAKASHPSLLDFFPQPLPWNFLQSQTPRVLFFLCFFVASPKLSLSGFTSLYGVKSIL